MQIAENSVVTFTYELVIIDEVGAKNQQVEKSKPLKVLMGRGNLFEPFERKLYGLYAGDSFEFLLKSDETFGPYKEKAVREFLKADVLKDIDIPQDQLEPGNYLPMETEDGTPFDGMILEITDDLITLDFNHPLAGKDLLFKGEIKSVREPTAEERSAGKILDKGKAQEK